MQRTVLQLAAGAALLAFPALLSAQVMDFEGLGDQEAILDYYDGGMSAGGAGPGPDYDIVWADNALSIIDADAGGTGNIANEPTPNTVLFWLGGTGAIMNHVGGGFTGGFSFWYSSSTEASVSVYSGLDGAGALLASIDLAANFQDDGCTGDPTGGFCHWDPVGVSFDGLAQSVDFSGTINQTAYDNITLRSDVPGGVAPEPGTVLLLASGLIGVAGVGLRRRRESAEG